MRRIVGPFVLLVLAAAGLPACDSGTEPPPAPVPVAAVEVAPKEDSLLVGGTRQLTSSVKDAAGNVLSGRRVTWATSDSGVARVDTLGLVTALASGTAVVSATAEGVRGEATLRVTPKRPVVRVVSPATDTTVGAFAVSVTIEIQHERPVLAVLASVNGAPETVVSTPADFFQCPVPHKTSCNFMLRGLSEGENTVVVTARDSAGTRGEARLRVTARVPVLAYRVTYLGTLGGADSGVADVNEKGEVVGSSTTANGETHAYVWRGGTMIDLGRGAGRSGGATALNDAGDVVGTTFGGPTGCSEQSVRWRPGTTVPEAIRCQTYAMDVDENGVVLHTAPLRTVYFHRDGRDSVAHLSEYPLQGVQFNTRHEIAAGLASSTRPFFVSHVSPGGVVSYLECTCTLVEVNETGTVLASEAIFSRNPGPPQVRVWRNGRTSSLGMLGEGSRPGGINDRDEIAGMDGGRIFLWREGTFHVVRPTDPDWVVDDIGGINNAGRIIAHGTNRATGARGALVLDPAP